MVNDRPDPIDIIIEGDFMETVTISSKFQVVIPRNVRDSLKLIPGQKVQVIQYGNRIELIPEKKISQMRGFLKGINTEINRERDRL
jgi:AbrB family looped-hinge helix DNA binding protein